MTARNDLDAAIAREYTAPERAALIDALAAEVRVATLREAADALEADARKGDQDGWTRIYKRGAVDFLRGMAAQAAEEPRLSAADLRGGQPDPDCADCRTLTADQTDPYAFVPPAADGLPTAALDSATRGASALDAYALTHYGRNLLAHALTGLARDGWLRLDPGQGWEPFAAVDSPADDQPQEQQ